MNISFQVSAWIGRIRIVIVVYSIVLFCFVLFVCLFVCLFCGVYKLHTVCTYMYNALKIIIIIKKPR